MKFISFPKLTIALACLAAAHGFAAQAGFPTKPITIVVGGAAGMGSDVVTRLIAEKMSIHLGQSVLVDNRPGAGGVIAANLVRAAAPDGYTLLMNASIYAIQAGLTVKQPYSLQRDFAHIGGMAIFPQLLVASPKLEAVSFADFVAGARKSTVNTASAGTGSTSHITMEMFKVATGIKTNHVPYRGSSDMQMGLISGDVAIGFDSVAASSPHIGPSGLKPMAVAMSQRIPLMPQVPTFAELGFPAVISTSWTGLSAPARTPVAVLDRLNAELRRAVGDPDVRARLANLGAMPLDQSREQNSEFVDAELEKWAKVVRDSGFKMP